MIPATKLKILLTGKNGQVGAELQTPLFRLGETHSFGHREMDLADADALRRTLQDVRPNLIVNAAAYTAVDQAEKEPDLARAINTRAPAVMATEAKRTGALLVHYSTDYVFDGSESIPYEETDPTNPINVYGRTKLEGEQAIQATGAAYLILRTSWVYATQGRSFLLTILRLASQREELRIVADQYGVPNWSRMIALGTAGILSKILSREGGLARAGEYSGIYHLTAAGQTSWCDFARSILEECSNPKNLGPWFAAATEGKPLPVKQVLPIPTSDYPTPARRPAFSVLSNCKLLRTFGIQLPGWRAQLHHALQDTPPEKLLTLVDLGLH